MVEKFCGKDVKKSNFSEQMEFRKRSNMVKVALVQMNPTIGALEENGRKIVHSIQEARSQGMDLVVFPEMALCGYPPDDLLLLPQFIEAVEAHLQEIAKMCVGIAAIVGSIRKNPHKKEKDLYNTAALLEEGKILGFQDKILLPDYDVFSERRYFEPGEKCDVWTFKQEKLRGKRLAITLCEDIWQHGKAVGYSCYRRDPVQELQTQAPDLVINLSASPYYFRRNETRIAVCRAVTHTLQCPVLLCNQVGGNDRLIFDGFSLYMDAAGEVCVYAKGFEEETLYIDLDRKQRPCTLPFSPIENLYQALVCGIRDYFHKQGFSKACLGLSGGIDSAVVACLAQEALGKDNLLALFLPSRYSSEESRIDASALALKLGIEYKEISIEKPFEAFEDTLKPYFFNVSIGTPLLPDTTEENLQARIRGVLLMAFSNKFGYLLLGTGNKSELALGYCTLYGDMCGGLGVLSDVTKEQVYALATWIKKHKLEIPDRILEKPPSAELKPNQKDSDTLPQYAIIDLVLKEYIEEHRSPQEIAATHSLALSLVKQLVRQIHLAEYKRQQAPPGLRVTKRAFTVGRRFPIVQTWNMSA